MIDADYVDDIALLSSTPAQAESLQHRQNKQRGALVSPRMQIKRSVYSLDTKEQCIF